jgi:hypothetical protein
MSSEERSSEALVKIIIVAPLLMETLELGVTKNKIQNIVTINS